MSGFTMSQILPILDEVFTPETTDFSEYLKWTSECNGDFYRICYRKLEEPIKEEYLGWVNTTHIVIAFDSSTPYSRDKLGFKLKCSVELTKLKMQLCPVAGQDVKEAIQWNIDMGYPTYKVIDLVSKKDVTDNYPIENFEFNYY